MYITMRALSIAWLKALSAHTDKQIHWPRVSQHCLNSFCSCVFPHLRLHRTHHVHFFACSRSGSVASITSIASLGSPAYSFIPDDFQNEGALIAPTAAAELSCGM